MSAARASLSGISAGLKQTIMVNKETGAASGVSVSDQTMKRVSLVVLIAQNSALALTMRYSRSVKTEVMYAASTAVFVCELLKLLVSLVLLTKEQAELSPPPADGRSALLNGYRVPASVALLHEALRSRVFVTSLDFVKLAVPGLLYTCQVCDGLALA